MWTARNLVYQSTQLDETTDPGGRQPEQSLASATRQTQTAFIDKIEIV